MSLFDFKRKKLTGQYSPQNAMTVRRRKTVATCAPGAGGSGANMGSGPGGPFSGGGMGSGGGQGNYGHSRYSGTYQAIELGSIINDWMPKDPIGLNMLFRQMYLSCSICGTAVDLMAGLLWSDADLMGMKDKGQLAIFENAMTNLHPTELMPAITTEFLTIGRASGNLLFDEGIGTWTGYMPHDPDFINVTPLPIFGVDPKLDMRLSPGLSRLIKGSKDQRDQMALNMLPPQLVQQMKSGKIELDPINTVFIPRRTLMNDFIGTSLFTRAIPFFALESSLFSGTLIAARRRQRSILHLEIGLDEMWEPDRAEMDDIVGLFMQADEDPQGAIVATRKGVQIQEVRDGQNFWKIGDEMGFINDGKMKALGLNEQFMSGDMNYNTMDANLSIFVERLRGMRDYITTKFFYQKAFPTLARTYGMRKIKKSELQHRVRVEKTKDEMQDEIQQESDKMVAMLEKKEAKRRKTYEQAFAELRKATTESERKEIQSRLKKVTAEEGEKIPESELLFPQIHWHKQLRPEADENYLQVLGIMEEKGIPIPLRTWANAGGIDLEGLMEMLKEDADLRNKIQDWKRQNGDQDQAAFASIVLGRKRTIARCLPVFKNNSALMGITAADAAAYIDTLQGNKFKITASPEDCEFDLNKHFDGNQYKVEAMKFVLKRIGLVNFAMSDKVVEQAMVNMRDKLSFAELQKEAQVIEKYRKKNATKFSPEVKKAIAAMVNQKDELGANSPDLYSGLKK